MLQSTMRNLFAIIVYLWTKHWIGVVIAIVLVFLLLNSLDLDFEPSRPKFFTGQD